MVAGVVEGLGRMDDLKAGMSRIMMADVRVLRKLAERV